jgi:hypothetical protein
MLCLLAVFSVCRYLFSKTILESMYTLYLLFSARLNDKHFQLRNSIVVMAFPNLRSQHRDSLVIFEALTTPRRTVAVWQANTLDVPGQSGPQGILSTSKVDHEYFVELQLSL